jgi:chloramphenicol O-acetyltransferase
LEEESESISRNDTFRTYIQSDILFIFEDIDSTTTVKQFSYYKTIVDGKIKNDESYEEFFTIYMKIKSKKKEDGKEEPKKDKNDNKFSAKSYQFNPIYSITRICAYNCKGY